MDTISFGIDVSNSVRENAACSNQFFETTASPTSLSAVSRYSVLVRDAHTPIQFPFAPHQLADVGE
ncbi:hypothetical protein BH10PSE12_BH10PSE12_18800 [soil metagenome]